MKALLMSVCVFTCIWLGNSSVMAASAPGTDMYAWSNVFKPAGQKPKLAYFTGDFCIPCKVVKPIIMSFKKQGVPVLTVDYDKHADFRMAKGIEQIPTVIVFDRNNREIARLVGSSEITAPRLYSLLKQAMAR